MSIRQREKIQKAVKKIVKEAGFNIKIEIAFDDHEDVYGNSIYAKMLLGVYIDKPCIIISQDVLDYYTYNEFKAIILHELGHIILQHNRGIGPEGELEADKWAVEHGACAKAFISSLLRMNLEDSRTINWNLSDTHPSVHDRAKALGINLI